MRRNTKKRSIRKRRLGKMRRRLTKRKNLKGGIQMCSDSKIAYYGSDVVQGFPCQITKQIVGLRDLMTDIYQELDDTTYPIYGKLEKTELTENDGYNEVDTFYYYNNKYKYKCLSKIQVNFVNKNKWFNKNIEISIDELCKGKKIDTINKFVNKLVTSTSSVYDIYDITYFYDYDDSESNKEQTDLLQMFKDIIMSKIPPQANAAAAAAAAPNGITRKIFLDDRYHIEKGPLKDGRVIS